MTGNDLIDDYLSELMDDPGKGKPGAAKGTPAEAEAAATPPAETSAEAAREGVDAAPAQGAPASDAHVPAEAASEIATVAAADVHAVADASADAVPGADTAAGADPLAAFRAGPSTIGEDEFEAMLDALQGKPAGSPSDAEPTPAATVAAAAPAGDPLAAFRDGSPTINDDEFEAMLDALQGKPASESAVAAQPAGDPLAAFRDGSPTINDDEFEAMLDALQGQPPAAAAVAATAAAAPAAASVVATPAAAIPAPAATMARVTPASAVPARAHPRVPQAVIDSMLPPGMAAPVHGEPALPPERRRRAEDRMTSWLRFSLARQSFAVEVLKVQEVLRVPSILPVRGTEQAMLGVMNLRGQIVPVMDLAIRLGFDRVDPTESSRVIVLEENGETLGLLVASVADVVNLSDSRMERISGTPSLVAAEVVRGIARREGVIIILLDASRLLA